jgi:hypothetical protein
VSAASKLLERLTRVKQTAPDRWLACCPAHQDKSPSLSIRELDDGRVLINCFGGCGALDVLDSLGLEWGALFPPNSTVTSELPAIHSRIAPRDLLEIISEEASIVAIVAADMRDKRAVSEADWKRLAQAAARIGKARDYVR